MAKQIKREPFDGRAGEMRDSPWMASEDLEGINSIDSVIANVYKNRDVEFEGGRSKDVVYSLEFSKAKRQLVLNGSNRKTLVGLYGADVKNWIGKTITVYVEEGIKVGRDIKKGLRVRASKETNQAKTQEKSKAALDSLKKS